MATCPCSRKEAMAVVPVRFAGEGDLHPDRPRWAADLCVEVPPLVPVRHAKYVVAVAVAAHREDAERVDLLVELLERPVMQ